MVRFDPLRPYRRADLPPPTGTIIDEKRKRRELLLWLALVAAASCGAVLWALALL